MMGLDQQNRILGICQKVVLVATVVVAGWLVFELLSPDDYEPRPVQGAPKMELTR